MHPCQASLETYMTVSTQRRWYLSTDQTHTLTTYYVLSLLADLAALLMILNIYNVSTNKPVSLYPQQELGEKNMTFCIAALCTTCRLTCYILM